MEPGMLAFSYYPVNDLDPLMKGLVIGGLGIFHVFLAQLAIGGGILMSYIQWLYQTGRCPNGRRFVDDYFRVLVLVSFVMGAVTGVAMWFTTIQISARTIGVMVREFHWLWAIEWTFFSLEVVSGYMFYRYGQKLPDGLRLKLLVLYSLAAWFSLFWINGILSWQLTPGRWLETRGVWDGFFNPSFWPSLVFRTISAMAEASLAACVLINAVPGFSREERASLISVCARPLSLMILMPLLGLWYIGVIPEDSRGWVTGGSIAMTMFLTLAVGSSALIGVYSLVAILREKLYVNVATSALLLFLAGLATAGGEFVREGVRKPFTIREYLYSNSLTPEDVAELRRTGCVSRDPYPLRDRETYPTPQVRLGAQVFRIQCSICHTLAGANALVELTETWSLDQKRLNFAQLQRTKAFMPPFAGTAEEVEALVQFITWRHAGRPAEWETSADETVQAQIQKWLDEAGTGRGGDSETVAARAAQAAKEVK